MPDTTDLIAALRHMEQKSQRAQESARIVAALPFGAEREKFVAEMNHDLSLAVAAADDMVHQIALVRQAQ